MQDNTHALVLKAQQDDKENIYVVTAMDAETYGHHIKDWEDLFLAEVYEEIQVRSETYGHIQQKSSGSSAHQPSPGYRDCSAGTNNYYLRNP